MKKYTLEFIDKELEVKIQQKENKDRILLMNLFLSIKVILSIIQILFNLINQDPIQNYKQGFVAFGLFSIFLLIFCKFKITVSNMANFVQLTMPVASILTNSSWTLLKPVATVDLFMYGGFKQINMITLYFLGTNFRSNSACYLFATILASYQYFPNVVTYNTTNYVVANIWVVVLKYTVDKDRRCQFLLRLKDDSWTLIMKEMIDDWVIMVTHNTQTDQITVRDANKNFIRSCKVNDDKNFRAFTRSIIVQDNCNENDLHEAQLYRCFGSDDQQIQSPKSNLNRLLFDQRSINKNEKCLDLDQVLRQNLLLSENKPEQGSIGEQSLEKQSVAHFGLKKFIGVRYNAKSRRQTQYSIKLIRGSDSQRFILLVIKQLKNPKIITQMSRSKIFQENIIKMSNLCDKYVKIIQQIYNEVKNQTNQNTQKTINVMQIVTSQIMTYSNSHYVQQLYLNQTYQISEFKFESQIQQINLKEMIKRLQLMKKDQIKIVFNKDKHQIKSVNSFQRELMHLFLIFIENTIKHSKKRQPTIQISYSDELEDIVRIKLQDQGQGMQNSLIKEFLDSYKIDISKKKKVIILDHQYYNKFVGQQMKYGWVSARLILSILSPFSDFQVKSEENQGCSITFSIFQDISGVVKIRNLESQK